MAIITSDSGINPINTDNMIPAQITDNLDDSYRDLVEITPKYIIESQKRGYTYKTSSGLLEDYKDKFESILESGEDVIHLSMSSGISEGSLNAANIVASLLEDEYENKVYVIDTLTGATGGTLINEIANNYAKRGLETKEIIDKLNKLKAHIKTSFYVPDPTGFIRSGRDKSHLYKEKALLLGTKVANFMNIKFRVDFNKDGNLYAHSFVRASDKLGMLKMVKSIINDKTIENYFPSYVALGNILEKNVSMEDVIDYINSFEYFRHVLYNDISGVVAAYGSEDLCGISLIKK